MTADPIKSCETCAHHRPDTSFNNPFNQLRFARCARWQTYCCSAIIGNRDCGTDLRTWVASPPPPPPVPRRSLRRWFVDTFLA